MSGLTPPPHCETLAPVRTSSLAFALCLIPVVTGCELVGGIEKITLVQPQADGGTEDAEPDAPGTCALPAEGDAFLRLGVFVPADDAFDFCVKPSGTVSWEGIRPVLASGGGGCPAGLGYKDMTMAFRVASGTYDVRMVEGDAQGCVDARAELPGVVVVENQVMTLMGIAGAESGVELRALPESQPAFNRTQMRFVHALKGYDKLDCGATDSSRLPATVLTSVFHEVAYGTASASGSSAVGSIDANGYLIYSFAGGTVRFGIARPQTTDALVTLALRFALSSSHTLFAVGKAGDPRFPPALWSCDEGVTGDGILAACGNPADVSVEVYSTQLTDLYTPLYRSRIAPVIDAIKKAESDIICVNEMRSPKNLDALLAATEEEYPYRVFSHQVELSDTDLSDQQGVVPEPYTVAACTGALETQVNELMDCVDQHCAKDEGSGHVFIDDGNEGADCVSDKCMDKAAALVLGGEDAKACWMCALTQMAGEETTEGVRDACTGDPLARHTYGGSLGLAVLSRLPLGDAKGWRLPSTGWMHGLLQVPVDLPNGVPLDLYCGDLTLPVTGIVFPYVGHYGGASEGDARWVAEQLLQAERVLELIEEQSGASGARAVLAATTYAGPDHVEGATRILAAQSLEVHETLLGALTPLVPVNYVPSCTQCLGNPVLASVDPADLPVADAWTTHLLGRGFAQQDVRETTVTFRDASYEVTAPEGKRMIPPSSQYGLRSVLRITQ